MSMTQDKRFEELLKRMPPFKKRKPKPEPAPKVVELASSNPDVPLERQRERISEAQRRLVEDEDRRLKEWEAQKRHERWLMERQAALDFWMAQKLANEEAERRFDKELDPFDIGIYGARPFHRGE